MKMRDVGIKDEVLRISKVSFIGAIFFMGLLFNVQLLAGMTDIPSEGMMSGSPLDRLRHVTLQDAVPFFEEDYGYTPVPEYQPLEVHVSDDPSYEYMAVSPYYTVYFKGNTVKMSFRNGTWIECKLEYMIVTEEPEGEQPHNEEVKTLSAGESVADQNMLSVSDVFESVDMFYTADTSLLREELVLEEFKQCTRIVQKVQWENITPGYQEDGSILFLNEKGERIVAILPPFMEDAAGTTCQDVHYELAETETGYELHKVIGDKGLEWLQKAVYPVTVDPTMQTFEDAWESSGLTPYGQYFKNLKEYVSPASGLLTIIQTDLKVPGRGLDLEISRIYNTPAIFYGASPCEYEAPPLDIGKGWQLDFPWVGAEYLHLYNGTMYKIEWSGNTFENHTGEHFVLVKNGDSTYTLTLADGEKCYFDSQGRITEIEDLHQNTIEFAYSSGLLTSITDTVGRVVTLTYSNDRLWKLTYNNNEIEYSYDNGCLVWMEDFLNRRTSYSYDIGYNDWLLSRIEYPAGGYTTYAYNFFSESGYYRYHVTHQRVHDADLVRHTAFTCTGSFEEITSSLTTIYNEFDQPKLQYTIDFDNGLVQWIALADAQDNEITKAYFVYNSKKDIVRKDVYSGGSESVSYSEYYRYDSWGNLVYTKDPSGHEMFYSYANTDTTGFFVDYDGAIVRKFTNSFIESSVPSSVHIVMLGMAERQGNGNMLEFYHEYTGPDLTESRSMYGPQTTWLTFSGTFNEKTGQTSFPIDLAGYTVAGNGVLQIAGLSSDDTYQESHSYSCEGQCNANCKSVSGSWQGGSFKLNYKCCRYELGEVVCGTDKTAYTGSFAHYPSTLGYLSYSTTPGMNQMFTTFLVKTFWKAYSEEVQYNLDQSTWKTVTSNLMNGQRQIAVPITDGTHTLYFSESSGYQTKFSWNLYVPVDATGDTYATTYTYDQYGNMTSRTNPQDHTTTYEYSANYDYTYLTSQTDIVDGQEITVSATYDFYLGLANSRTCACGSVTDYEYDVLGRMTKIIYPLVLGEQERAEYEVIYDDVNGTVTVFNENDEKTVQYYDGLNRMVKEERYTDVLWAVSEYSYNYLNKPKQVTDPLSRVYQCEYDAVGRVTKLISPDFTYSMLQYDDLNNIVTLQDGNQHTKEYTFDWEGNLASVKEHNDAATYETQYQYDELSNLIQMINPEQDVYTYEYDSLFGITEAVYPDETEQHFSYDAVGNLIERVDQNGTVITYTYDAASRLKEIDYQDQSVSFTYNQVGQRTSMVTPDMTTYYQYDERNRLKEIEYVIDSTSYVIQYAFDPAGNITQITYPDSSVVQYAYFLKDLLESIQGFATFSYLADSSLEQIAFSNGVTTDYGYDSTGRIQALHAYTGADLLDLEYTYDDAGNITQISNNYSTAYQQWMTTTESYTYDDLNRVTSASNGFGTISYEYDSTKRLSIDENGQVTSYTYEYDLLMSSGSTTYTYDSNGNTLTKSGDSEWDYHYDNANRLVEVDKDDQTVAEYVYDGDGKRIKKTEWSDSLQDYETTLCMYSGGNVIYEENDTGTATYVYGPSGRIAEQTTINNETTTYYYHTDHLGSTRMVTDGTGTPLTSVTYYPFGRTNECTGSSQSYLFIGKEEDAAGLYYLNQRYYDPETGRFITRDPYTWRPDDPRSSGNSGDLIRWLITPQRFDGYSYAENNPVRYSDSTGLSHSLVCCDNQACTNFCADDDAANSNPGGTEGSQQYTVGDPDDQSNNSQKGKPDECDEECQRQKRLKEQGECQKKCKEDSDVKELLRLRRFYEIRGWIYSIVGVFVCAALATTIVLGILCGLGALGLIGGGAALKVANLENEIRRLGCACVL